MQTKAFFGDNGLTSTSANHYANLAKEANRKNMNFLANARFYSEEITVIGSEVGGKVSTGMNDDELLMIEAKIKEVGELNSLVAFFREAIKEKERLGSEASRWIDGKMREEFAQRKAELEARKPQRPTYLTEDDVRSQWSVGEQEKYLSLEAEAAAIGKFIHEDGCISLARIDLMQKLRSPQSVAENGRDTIIHTYTPTVSEKDVDDMFFRLQARHRAVQAELNGMKKSILDAIEEHKMTVDAEYRLALSKWNEEFGALAREQQLAEADESAERMRRQQYVAGLKIVVPNRLKAVLESLK
ncbi:MAG: hypothetical protein J6U33_06280 [Paludibacteraceae bacterium]|nr:hypothetical protein [Paludibacteraceae bacterium]